jgi:hypothetical protein
MTKEGFLGLLPRHPLMVGHLEQGPRETMSKDQSKIVPAVGKSWKDVAAQTTPQKEIYPKLFDALAKHDEATFTVEFIQAEPESIEFPDKFADKKLWKNDKPPMVSGFAINVRNLETDSLRSIVFRDDPEHGLVRGIATLAKANGGSLLGVTAKVELRNYNHRQYGPTRGYNVYQVGVKPADEAP